MSPILRHGNIGDLDRKSQIRFVIEAAAGKDGDLHWIAGRGLQEIEGLKVNAS